MRRGELFIVAPPGEFGKPRPALAIQTNNAVLDTITFLPITSNLQRSPVVRILIQPTPENGLRVISEVMIDRLQTVTLAKIGPAIGLIDSATMYRVEVALLLFLGLA